MGELFNHRGSKSRFSLLIAGRKGKVCAACTKQAINSTAMLETLRLCPKRTNFFDQHAPTALSHLFVRAN